MVKVQQILGVNEREINGEKRSFWTRIGTAFENKDGSLNLRFDYYPTDPAMTIQIREFDKKDGPTAPPPDFNDGVIGGKGKRR